MKLALNGATTMKADLQTDIRAASAAGFDCLEIWAAKLRRFLASNTTAELKELLDASGLEPYSINSIERITYRDENARDALRQECAELCRVASEIGCPYVVVVPGPLPEGESRAGVVAESARVLGELGELAGEHGVGLAFEFLGQTDCSVQTLELASEIVGRVGRANVGLVIDSFHFYAGGSTIASIEALDAGRLFIFHINDAEDLPRAELADRHRLLPGLGILPLKEIVGALRRTGYDRVASVEIFRPEYWERDPVELAREAHAAVSGVVNG
ncbi:MAG TPA: sugar phosphate isomerase/epimerase family protein [Pyrinomonadaceae bacterium]|nr:sugar phosphate isomerase/epimerase family protein [Pyrinomonadaceae bacterium]